MRTAPTSVVVLTAFGLRQCTRARHDLGPVRARRCQHTVISHQVEARRWYQGGEFFEQFLRRQQQLAGTVGPVRLQREHKRLLIHEAQPAAGNGWPDHVAAKPFESAPIGRLDTGGCMQ